jgi:hypothetical protein
MTVYRVEFGPAWPVPPITVDFADRTAATRAVAEHAIPHLTPTLAEKGRLEFADCFFQTDAELTVGQFMWLDLAAGRGARFCPARLTPADDQDDVICGDENDGDWCELEPGHEGHHRADTVEWAREDAATPAP